MRGISQQAGSSCHDLPPGEAAVDVANMLVAGAERLGLCLSRPHRTISFAAADGVGGGAEKNALLVAPTGHEAGAFITAFSSSRTVARHENCIPNGNVLQCLQPPQAPLLFVRGLLRVSPRLCPLKRTRPRFSKAKNNIKIRSSPK